VERGDQMNRTRIAIYASLFALTVVGNTHAFDYDSYKPGDLDQILGEPRPQSGMTITGLQKLRLSVTLESYAESCGMGKALTFSMSMLPTVYPRGFVDAISMSQCIKVKSAKGSLASLVIQDKVAEFLPKEVPLGTRIDIYCVLIGLTPDGPGMIVSEFQVPQ
jgi:hypothetical protein